MFFIIGCSSDTQNDTIILSPEPPADIFIKVFDPVSGLNEQRPATTDWGATVRWQGSINQTFKQIEFNRYSSAINTNNKDCKEDCKLPFREVIGGGPHNVVSYGRADNPQSVNRGLKLTWYQSVDDFQSNGGVAQLCSYFYLKHKSGITWAVVINSWDNRIDRLNYSPYVGNDTYTWFISFPVGNSQYASSDQRQQNQLSPWQKYTVTITASQFQNMLDSFISQGVTVPSRDLREYGIIDAGILHEIFTFNNPEIDVKSYVTFSTLKVETLE